MVFNSWRTALASRLNERRYYNNKERVRSWMKENGGTLPVCVLNPDPQDSDRNRDHIEAQFYQFAMRFKQAPIQWDDEDVFRKPTATILDVQQFSTFNAYERAVSAASHGNINRYVKKARRLGLQAKLIDYNAYRGSIDRIQRSKLFRTSGVMLEALRLRAKFSDQRAGERHVPACQTHWTICWGVFKGETLVAYALLMRCGKIMRTVEIMGERDALSEGATKLLVFDVVRALINVECEMLSGIRYFLYGALEQGGDGLLDWKLRMQFQPHLLKIELPTNRLPAGFDAVRYQQINPDVRTAKLDAGFHYLFYGRREGRRFK